MLLDVFAYALALNAPRFWERFAASHQLPQCEVNCRPERRAVAACIPKPEAFRATTANTRLLVTAGPRAIPASSRRMTDLVIQTVQGLLDRLAFPNDNARGHAVRICG